MRSLILSLSLLWSSCCFCGDALAQPRIEVVTVAANEPIKLEKLDQFVWGGFEGARVVDGKVIAKVTSKPKFESTTSQIVLTLGDGYEVDEIIAESDEAYIDLDQTPIDGGKVELTFPPDTPEGMYRIEVRAAKEGSRKAVKRLKVKIGGDGDGPAPPDIDIGDLPATSKAARKVMIDYVQAMAQDMENMSANISKYKTVTESSKAFNDLDLSTRNSFKAGIANVMKPRLGADALPADAASVFKEIAVGYRSIK